MEFAGSGFDWPLVGAATVVGAMLGAGIPPIAARIPRGAPRAEARAARGRAMGGCAILTAAAACVIAAESGALILLVGPALLIVITGAYVDARTHRLPDALTLPLFAAAVVPTLATGRVGSAALAAAIYGGSFAVFAAVGSGLGWGDAKLAAGIGGWIGALAPHNLLVAMVAPFLAAGIIALVLLVMRRITRRTAIPFGPFMAAGFTLALIA